MKHRNQRTSARIDNRKRASASLLLVVSLTVLLAAETFQFGVLGCESGYAYFLEAESGGVYALVGLPSSLRSQFGNHTTRISVNGTYYLSNPASFIHPNPNYRGLIYVTQYSINGSEFTFAQTVVMVSGTVTSTLTITSQVSPTTITQGTITQTLVPITVAGLLDYSQEYCITTLASTSSSTRETGNSNLTIPGFTSDAVILGLLAGIAILAYERKRAMSSAR